MELYDQLLKESQAKSYGMTNDNFEKLAYYLSKLEQPQQEVCLALILEKYYRDTGSGQIKKRTLPYGGSAIQKEQGAKFIVSKLPHDLVSILMFIVEKGAEDPIF